MQSLKRALLFGLATWFIWVSLVVIAFEALPTTITGSAFFVSMKIVTLVILLLSFTLLYLRKVKESSLKEGLLIGLSWTAIIIALDLAHYFMVPFDIGQYFLTTAPIYIIVPITTILIMGFLKLKSSVALNQ